MSFYQLVFHDCVAEEGDCFQTIPYAHCSQCGLKSPPKWDTFPTPEDTVLSADFLFHGEPCLPLYEAAGVLIAEKGLVARFKESGITGFEARVATASCSDEGIQLPQYEWVAITGRCITSDIHTRVTSTCKNCGRVREETFYSTTRTPSLHVPLPQTDLSRAREVSAGIIVSERLVEVVRTFASIRQSDLEFRPIRVGRS